jgi:hypothetical protein
MCIACSKHYAICFGLVRNLLRAKSCLGLIKLKLVNIVKCTMNRKELSNNCKNGNHIDCEECVCKCHIPGTMEYMSRNIARLEKERPGLGESLPAFTQ